MTIQKIKPIPKYMVKLIQKKDKECYSPQDGNVRFYAYLTKNNRELVKVTVAVRNWRKKWFIKQVAIHGIHSDICFTKDICFYYIGGYKVGWYKEGLYTINKWYEDGEWGWNEDRLFDPYAIVVNRDYLKKCMEYRYAAWELYYETNILQFLRSYEKYPCVEYLTKLGLHHLCYSKQILEKATKDKSFRRWIGRHKEELLERGIYVAAIIQAYAKKKEITDVQTFMKTKMALRQTNDLKEIREIVNKDKNRFLSYIVRQKTNLSSYRDYCKACIYLNLDMSLEKNKFPRDFRRWHDIRIDEYNTAKALADKKEREELYFKFSRVAEKYMKLQKIKDNYAIVIAKSPTDLIQEGERLHHCVGRMNYDQKFVREESLIFFVRNKAEIDKPFVTMEYSIKGKSILQCYGENDSKPEDKVMDFVKKKWLPFANKQIKNIQPTI